MTRYMVLRVHVSEHYLETLTACVEITSGLCLEVLQRRAQYSALSNENKLLYSMMFWDNRADFFHLEDEEFEERVAAGEVLFLSTPLKGKPAHIETGILVVDAHSMYFRGYIKHTSFLATTSSFEKELREFMKDRQKLMEDRFLFGNSFERNGRRVDPTSVLLNGDGTYTIEENE